MAAAAVANTLFRRSVTSAAAPRAAATFGRRAVFAPRCREQMSRPFSSSITREVKKYTQDHEWIELNEDGTIGTIGITTYAAHALGDVVFVELPTLDLQVNAGDSIGAVESVKSASDIMTPVSGTIVEANSALEDTPSNINKDPEGGKGWLAKIKVADAKEVEGLMDEGAYKSFTEDAAE